MYVQFMYDLDIAYVLFKYVINLTTNVINLSHHIYHILATFLLDNYAINNVKKVIVKVIYSIRIIIMI